MRILVCGNRAEHEWPESCLRALRRLGHEAELVYYREPTERDLERFVPAHLARDVPFLLKSYEGRKALMEVVFYNLALELQPQLVLLAGMYHSWSADALADLREALDTRVVLWSGDDPYEPGATDVFAPGRFYDRAYFTIHGLAERAAGDLPETGFLPFGCDPERDRLPEAGDGELAPYRCQISYLGTLKLDRAQLLEELARSGLDLKVWGAGFPADLARRHPGLAAAHRPESVQGERARLLYGACDVVLNLHHKGFGNMKFYEVASCGAFQISNLRRDAEAIQGELPFFSEVVTFDDPRELPALARSWLERPEERLANARHLQAVVRSEHTWGHRLRALIEGVLPQPVPVDPNRGAPCP